MAGMTTRAPFTDFELDAARLAVIAECTKDWDVAEDDSAEWPNNIFSRRTVVYDSGRISRTGQEVTHAVDPDELELCRRLSSEIAAVMAGTDVGMGSEASSEFEGFFIAGNVGDAVAGGITEATIRERFGGTIFPPAKIAVDPLTEQGAWGNEVITDYEDSERVDELMVQWRRMIDWFKGRAEFVETAFVRIDVDWDLTEEVWPVGTVMTGSVLPRLALGLTRGCSLVGLFGYSVQT